MWRGKIDMAARRQVANKLRIQYRRVSKADKSKILETDWTVRDDVRAKLRSSIKRLLVKYNPPDKQPAAIKQVIDQMEELAPQYAERARRTAEREEVNDRLSLLAGHFGRWAGRRPELTT